MADFNTPENVKAITTLVALGMSDSEIAAAINIARGTVLRIRQENGIDPGRERYGAAPEQPTTPRAELVAAAKPKAQRPWSAKAGLR